MQAENVIALDFFLKKGMHLNSFNAVLVLLQFLNNHKHPIIFAYREGGLFLF